MGSFFRSEEMVLCQLFMQPEAAYGTVALLGEAGVVQFIDSNTEVSLFQRKFANEVRRCNEMERRLRYIEEELEKDNIRYDSGNINPTAPNPREVIDLEARLENLENEILELSQNGLHLRRNRLELIELGHVIAKAEGFLASDYEYRQELRKMSVMNMEDNKGKVPNGQLGFVSGVVNRERVPAFEQMLWRISRGNVFFKHSELEEPLVDPATGIQLRKTVFVAFFQGDQIKSKVRKVCEGFRATLYPCPNKQAERKSLMENLKTRVQDIDMILNQTEDHRHRVLFSSAKELPKWAVMVRKVKAIFHTLNYFNMDVSKKCLIGECWVPLRELEPLQKLLTDGAHESGAPVQSFLNCIQTDVVPPTFNRTNKFTKGFQNLIEAYGIASYREVNPALYTIITFPFLFAVMFGDIGHGAIVSMFGAFMVIRENRLPAKTSNEIWNMFFGGRYIILLMGLFSIYTGFVYNDCFSKSFNIFGSSWRNVYNESTLMENGHLTLDPKEAFLVSPYFIGVDPIWQAAANNIVFLNSFKMKMSIIFGVIHMIFGVCMSVINHCHFKHYSHILLEFLPQLIFLIFLFFYLVVMMFIKWSIYTAQTNEIHLTPGCAPSVLILFINMMLMKHYDPSPGCREYMFEGQEYLQYFLLTIGLLCVPVMLLGKPLHTIYLRRQKTYQPDEHGEESFGELMIIQAIHTIEYVLSTVSHTASYLRLWALSLAHAQLSAVLWSMVLTKLVFNHYLGAAFFFIVFAPWAMLTLAILVLMEGLSAFLHTLRLHWVEFMSKFYTGMGYPFQPFCFKTILEEESQPKD